MCGRYRRKSDKKRIADAFEVSVGLEELDLAPEDDVAPGSIQPVISINQDGERLRNNNRASCLARPLLIR